MVQSPQTTCPSSQMSSPPAYDSVVWPPQFRGCRSACFVRKPSNVTLLPCYQHGPHKEPELSVKRPTWVRDHCFLRSATLRPFSSATRAAKLPLLPSGSSNETYTLDFSVKPFVCSIDRIVLCINYLRCSIITANGNSPGHKPGRMTLDFVPVHLSGGQHLASSAMFDYFGRGCFSAEPTLWALQNQFCFESSRTKSNFRGTKLATKKFGFDYFAHMNWTSNLAAIRLVVKLKWFPAGRSPHETDVRTVRLDLVIDVGAFSQDGLLKRWDLASVKDASTRGLLTISRSPTGDLQMALSFDEGLMSACDDHVQLTIDTQSLARP